MTRTRLDLVLSVLAALLILVGAGMVFAGQKGGIGLVAVGSGAVAVLSWMRLGRRRR